MVEALLVDIALIFYYSLPYQLLNPNTFPHCYLVTKVHGNDQVKQKGFCLECTKCLVVSLSIIFPPKILSWF